MGGGLRIGEIVGWRRNSGKRAFFLGGCVFFGFEFLNSDREVEQTTMVFG